MPRLCRFLRSVRSFGAVGSVSSLCSFVGRSSLHNTRDGVGVECMRPRKVAGAMSANERLKVPSEFTCECFYHVAGAMSANERLKARRQLGHPDRQYEVAGAMSANERW